MYSHTFTQLFYCIFLNNKYCKFELLESSIRSTQIFHLLEQIVALSTISNYLTISFKIIIFRK